LKKFLTCGFWLRSARTRLIKLINTQNWGTARSSLILSAILLIYKENYAKNRSLEKIRESVTASLIVIKFRNTTPGGPVNINVLWLDLYKEYGNPFTHSHSNQSLSNLSSSLFQQSIFAS
jgi:hypothetical protein